MTATPNKNLINARKKLGLSQIEAAKEIGIGPSMLAMLETGDRKGSDTTKIKVANFYGLPIEYLFFTQKITKSEKYSSC